MKNQHTFPQSIGKLIEQHIIKTDHLTPNRRQQSKGYYDAYNHESVFEIKAAKDNNPFRLMQRNHKLLKTAGGMYVLVRYSLINNDKELKVISDIKINKIRYVNANEIETCAKSWISDQRKTYLYYKVKL